MLPPFGFYVLVKGTSTSDLASGQFPPHSAWTPKPVRERKKMTGALRQLRPLLPVDEAITLGRFALLIITRSVRPWSRSSMKAG